MEDKFSPHEILEYLRSQITQDTPISKKLSLYTQATQNQLDNSETSLTIWMEYIEVIYENEMDIKTVQNMYKMLIGIYGRYLKFWKLFIEFMRIDGSEKKIVKRYRDEIRKKSYAEKSDILAFFDDVMNEKHIFDGTEQLKKDVYKDQEIRSVLLHNPIAPEIIENNKSECKGVGMHENTLLKKEMPETSHVNFLSRDLFKTNTISRTWFNNKTEDSCKIKYVDDTLIKSTKAPLKLHTYEMQDKGDLDCITPNSHINNSTKNSTAANEIKKEISKFDCGNSPHISRMRLNETTPLKTNKSKQETTKTRNFNTPKSQIQNISDEIDKISLTIKKPAIESNTKYNKMSLGINTGNIELDFCKFSNPYDQNKENRETNNVQKYTGNFIKTKMQVDTQDVIPDNILTFHSTINKKDSSSSTLNTERTKRKEIMLNGNSYEVVSVAGKGGFGTVFQVLRESKIYALKKIDIVGMEDHIVKAYINEIDILKRLSDYEQVIKMHDYQIIEDNILILMEYGKIDLLQEFKKIRNTQQSLNYLKYLWEQLISCVKVIHENKIIHRDLKPANFLVVDGRIKLIDFGISKKIRGDTTNVNVDKTMGTVIYMAPETIKNTDSRINRKSDIWSLGCILYESLYGKPPFKSTGNGINAMNCITDDNYQIDFPELSQKHNFLINIIKKCLTRDVQKRCTIQELHELISEKAETNTVPVPKSKLLKLIKTLLKHNPDERINLDVQVESIYKEFLKKI